MNKHRVLWVEGILLSQQHLQQADAYHEEQYRGLWKLQASHAWGLAKLTIDHDALLNGVFRIKDCLVIFPHGLLIEYHADQQTSLACELKEHHSETIEIYLGVPHGEQAAAIQGYPNMNQATTWQGYYSEVADQYDEKRKAEVLFGRINLCLLHNKHKLDAYYCLKIAEVKLDINGQFVLNNQFIPCIVWISASPYLKQILQGLIELIRYKIRCLRDILDQLSDINDSRNWHCLLLCQELSRSLPLLQHLVIQERSHPQLLYLALAALYGAMSLHAKSDNPIPLPNYQHENLNAIYPQIEQSIRELLDNILPIKVTTLQLSHVSDGLYTVEEIPRQFLLQANFFIAVKYPASDLQWVEQFIKQAKVGSKNTIRTIVASALPGVSVRHIPHPPKQLPLKLGYEYFYLEPHGEYWRFVEKEASLAVFLTHLFRDAKLELVTNNE